MNDTNRLYLGSAMESQNVAPRVFRISYGWRGRMQLSSVTYATHEEARLVAAGMSCPARVVACEEPGIEDADTDARDAFDDALDDSRSWGE